LLLEDFSILSVVVVSVSGRQWDILGVVPIVRFRGQTESGLFDGPAPTPAALTITRWESCPLMSFTVMPGGLNPSSSDDIVTSEYKLIALVLKTRDVRDQFEIEVQGVAPGAVRVTVRSDTRLVVPDIVAGRPGHQVQADELYYWVLTHSNVMVEVDQRISRDGHEEEMRFKVVPA
jgi:hypothetical protein